MATANKIGKSYDYVLVGHCLGSFVLAKKLKEMGQSFCLVDSEQITAHTFKHFSAIDRAVYTHLPYNSCPEDYENLWGDFDSLPVNVAPGKTIQGPPLTFEKGQFKSFLGFGDVKVDAIDEINYFCQPQLLLVPNQPEDLWQELLGELEEWVFTDQQLTDLTCEDHHVSSITFNGKTQVTAKNFVFFNHTQWLLDRLAKAETSLAPPLKKMKWYSAVTLVFHHAQEPEAYELDSPYLLMGSKQQPCLGQFSRLGEHLISRWQSFVPAELTVDSETVGAAVKEIKKQIKRAFGSLIDERPPEQIIIHQSWRADLSPLQKKLSNFNNLSLIDPSLIGQRGWLHELVLTSQISLPEAPAETTPPLSL